MHLLPSVLLSCQLVMGVYSLVIPESAMDLIANSKDADSAETPQLSFIFEKNRAAELPNFEASSSDLVEFIENSIPFQFDQQYHLKSQIGDGSDSMALLFDQLSGNVNGTATSWDSVTKSLNGDSWLKDLRRSVFCTSFTREINGTNLGYCIQLNPDGYVNIFLVNIRSWLQESQGMEFLEPSSKVSSAGFLSPELSGTGATQLKEALSRVKDKAKEKIAANRPMIRQRFAESMLSNNYTLNSASIPLSEFSILRNARSKNYSQVLIPTREMLEKLGYKINGKFAKRQDLEIIMATETESQGFTKTV